MNELNKTPFLFSKTASLITILGGCFVLVGWMYNIPFLKTELPGINSMKFNTACCFISTGFTLYILQLHFITQRHKTIASILSSLVLLIGLLSLSQYLFGWNLGIDQLIWKEVPATTSFPGRMSLMSSFNFLLLGTLFLILLGKIKTPNLIVPILLFIISGSFTVIFNHLFINSFLSYIPFLNLCSLHSTILFLVICAGIFFGSPLRNIHFSFRTKLTGFLAMVLLLLGMIFFAVKKNREQTLEAAHWVEHTHSELFLVQTINSKVSELQSGVRGYLLTGDKNYLPLFNNSADSIDSYITKLKILRNENNKEILQTDTLNQLIKSYIIAQVNLITLSRNNRIDSALNIFRNGQEKIIIDKVRSIIKAIDLNENEQLTKRKNKSERGIENSSRLIFLFQIITILLLFSAILVIYENTRIRNKAEADLLKVLKDLKDYKRALNESSIVAITNQTGRIEHINDNFCKISKYKREELIGQDHSIINSGYHPKEYVRDLWTTITSGKTWKGDFKNKAKDGSFYWMHSTIVPFLNEKGESYRYISIFSDITERKKIEEELKNQAIELKNSNAELEHFANAASHDLQEPLRMISSFLVLLEKRLDGQLNDTDKQYIHFALDGADRMKRLIQDMLEYSRTGTNKENLIPTDFNEVLQYTTLVLKDTINDTKALITIKPLPVLLANKTLICQLFINLLSNALKYSTPNMPQIEVGFTDNQAEYTFYVKDNGIGINPDFFDQIFIIFKRLHNKSTYPGTGIGLAICKKIVEIHKGKIWVVSESGKGSTFYFSIPKLTNNL
jgi:PAS domain S-box-containing protein